MATSNQARKEWPAVSKTVHEPSEAVKWLRDRASLPSTLMGGTIAMRAAGTTYLPAWPKEEKDSYARRLETSTLYPAYSYTVETLSAKPFSQELTIESSERIEELMEDIDLQGRNGHAFAADTFQHVMAEGLGGILVEYPTARDAPATQQGVRTQQQEQDAGLRPYWVYIDQKSILGWKHETVAGKTRLLQLRFLECVEEPSTEPGEEFKVNKIDQVRVLEPGRWAIYRKDRNDKTLWKLHDNGLTTLGEVPFAPCYGKRLGFMVGIPPMLELAHLNCKHWQSQSDQDYLLHVARVPILALTGVDTDDKTKKPFELVVGSSAAVSLPKDADLKYVEHTGEAVSAGKVSLDDLKEEMRQSGASMLVIQPGVITATQVEHESAPARCALERMVLLFEDSLNLALEFTRQWIGEEQEAEASVFKDFGAAQLAEASASLLLQSRNTGVISSQTYFEELKRRGILAPDRQWDEEQALVEAEGLNDPEEDPNAQQGAQQ